MIAIMAEMKTVIKTNQGWLEAKLESNNEKSEVLRGALFFRTGSTQPRQKLTDGVWGWREIIASLRGREPSSRATSIVGRRYQAVQW
jgi:hypothetical protein